MIKIFETISSDINEVKTIIQSLLIDKHQAVQDSYNYLTEHTGKMIRPSLVIISAMLCNKLQNKEIQKIAATIELLHIASLVHDDVIDDAKMRRGYKTISYIHGNKHAVIIGDIIISESFKLLCSLGNIDIANEVVMCVSNLSEGEIIQDKLTGNIDLTIAEYIDIINKKTASLFAISMKLPFLFFNQNYEKAEKLGNIIGIIFQLIDDILDYSGNFDNIGKNEYIDFFESKVTLPIILLKQQASNIENKKLKEIFVKKDKTSQDLDYVNNLLAQYNIIVKCRDYVMENYIYVAKNEIMRLDNREVAEILTKTVDFIVQRSY